MKMTELKNIIKECIQEVLSENKNEIRGYKPSKEVLKALKSGNIKKAFPKAKPNHWASSETHDAYDTGVDTEYGERIWLTVRINGNDGEIYTSSRNSMNY